MALLRRLGRGPRRDRRRRLLLVLLHAVDAHGDLVGDDLQEGLVPLVEGQRIAALEAEHADEPIAGEERQRELRPDIGQSGERDLRREPGAAAAIGEALADRVPVADLRADAGDAHHAALGRGDAHDAVADRDLGAHPFRTVAPAGNRHQPALAVVGNEHHRMAEGEELVEPREGAREQRIEIAGAGDLPRDRLQTPKLRELVGRRVAMALRVPVGGSGRRRGERVDELLHLADRLDLVDVGREQAEDALHPGVRSDHLDARRHGLEERTCRLEMVETQLEAVELERPRVPEVDRGVGVLVDVAPRLVEELAGERDVLRVDEIDLREIGDVRLAVTVRRRDHRRNDALEAGLQLLQPDRHAPTPPWERAADSGVSGLPAPGPGVCSKSASQRSVTVKAGQWFIDLVAWRGTPT